MAEQKRMYNGQIEINDLIDDAVKNAVTRRNEAFDSEAALLSMSDEEAKSVAGGTSLATIQSVIIKQPIIQGVIIKPPITIGIVAPTKPLYS